MAYLNLPIRSDIPAYQYQLALEGLIYTFSFNYNSRMDRWIMNIMNQDESPILMGIVLLASTFLTSGFANESLPPGLFFLTDTENGDTDPGLADLGTRFLLTYRESTTPDDE